MTSSGTECRSIWIDFSNSSPVVFYYLRKIPLRNSRVEIVEKFGGTWTVTELPDQLHGNPVGYEMDSNGNVIIAGYNMSAEPRYSSIGVLMN